MNTKEEEEDDPPPPPPDDPESPDIENVPDHPPPTPSPLLLNSPPGITSSPVVHEESNVIPPAPSFAPPSWEKKRISRINTWSDLKVVMSPPSEDGNKKEQNQVKSSNETMVDAQKEKPKKDAQKEKPKKDAQKEKPMTDAQTEKQIELIRNKFKIQIQNLRTKHTQEVTEIRRRWLEARLELDRMDRQFEKMSEEYESKSKEMIAVKFGREREHENALAVSQAHKRTRRLLLEETARRKRVEKLLEATQDAMQKQKRNHNTMKERYNKLRKASRHYEYKENKYRIHIQNLEVERRDHIKRIYEANDTQEKMQTRIENLETELTSLRSRLECEHRDNKLHIEDGNIETKDQIVVVESEEEERIDEETIVPVDVETIVPVDVETNAPVAEEEKKEVARIAAVSSEEKEDTNEVFAIQQEETAKEEKPPQTKDQPIDVPCLASALQGWWKSVERKRKLGVR